MSVLRDLFLCVILLYMGCIGGFLVLFKGRKLIRWWIWFNVLILLLYVKLVIDDLFVWIFVLLSFLVVIVFCVMVLIMFGFVINMYEVFCIMKIKLVIVGEYMFLLVYGFMMIEICGIILEVLMFWKKILLYFLRVLMFFWICVFLVLNKLMIGVLIFRVIFWIL